MLLTTLLSARAWQLSRLQMPGTTLRAGPKRRRPTISRARLIRAPAIAWTVTIAAGARPVQDAMKQIPENTVKVRLNEYGGRHTSR